MGAQLVVRFAFPEGDEYRAVGATALPRVGDVVKRRDERWLVAEVTSVENRYLVRLTRDTSGPTGAL